MHSYFPPLEIVTQKHGLHLKHMLYAHVNVSIRVFRENRYFNINLFFLSFLPVIVKKHISLALSK